MTGIFHFKLQAVMLNKGLMILNCLGPTVRCHMTPSTLKRQNTPIHCQRIAIPLKYKIGLLLVRNFSLSITSSGVK